jgi:uncharacterized SAM-binding protein YcdF (DUF218 family)
VTYLHAGLCLLVLLAGIGGIRAVFRRGRFLPLAAALVLFVWCWPPFGWWFSGTLERGYPAQATPGGAGDAMVVLSAGLYPADATQPEALPAWDCFLRCERAVWLYRNWKALPIVVSGGEVSAAGHAVMAEVMRRFLEQAGIPGSMIWTEGASRNTYENARNTAEVLRAKGISRIVLVTEAYHMRRAERCFRKQGLEVTPAPCAFRSVPVRRDWTQYFPSPQAIRWNEDAVHEWVGLLWYRVMGRI